MGKPSNNKNEIKKLIYKQSPIAELRLIRGGNLYYICEILSLEELTTINFCVPISDIGNTDFFGHVLAKLLLRWLTDD